MYPLAKASAPPQMEFINGSGKDIDTLFPDNFRFFELLAMIVEEEPLESFGPLERSMMQAIGIEKGKPFKPDDATKALLSEAARIGGAMARANTYASSTAGFYYPRPQVAGRAGGHDVHVHARRRATDRCEEQRLLHGCRQLASHDGEERRAGARSIFGPIAIAMETTLMVPRTIACTSRPTSLRRTSGRWSSYDALSRSELQNGQPFPSVSVYTKPKINTDGSVDIFFGPEEPKDKGNWIKTVRARGGFLFSASTAPRNSISTRRGSLRTLLLRHNESDYRPNGCCA